MTATAAVSRDATVSLRDMIALEPERTATRQRIDHLWQRALRQPADDCRFAIADLVNARHLERTGPSQWTTTTAHHRLVAAFEAIVKKNELVAPPVPFAEPEEDTGDPTDDDGAADDPKAAFDDDPAESVRTLPAGHVTVTLNAGADPAQQVKVSGPRAQVDAVVRAYLRQRVAGKAVPLHPREIRVGKDMLEPRPKNKDELQAKLRAIKVAGLAAAARNIYNAIVRKPATTPDLSGRADVAGMPYNTLRGRVSELHTKGLIRRRDDGVWEAT